MKQSLYILLFLFSSVVTFAQDEEEEIDPNCIPPTEKSAVKKWDKAHDSKKYDYKERMRMYKDLLEEYKDNAAIMWEIAKMTFPRAKASGDYSIPEKYYKMILTVCPEYHADVYYQLGLIYYKQKNDCKAYTTFQQFLDFPSDDDTKLSRKYPKQLEDVEAIMPEIDYYCNFYKKPVQFNPKVVKNVSSAGKHEFLPMISPDNELMYYTREYEHKEKGDLLTQKIQEFTESKRNDAYSSFDTGTKMPAPFNVGPRYGGATLSLDNKELYICSCEKEADYFNCDIFVTQYDIVEIKGKKKYIWSELKNLGDAINGSKTWEAQPSLSADGKTLYFASARPGGIGKTDIYFSERQADGSWSIARNMGRPVNTEGADKVPFIHTDSKTLYFVSECSQYRLGAGGLDIFYTRFNETTQKWSKPNNIGYPINTKADEDGIIVSTDGQKAYFSSTRSSEGVGGKDIFTFTMPLKARPDEVKLIKGKVNAVNLKDLKETEVEFRYKDGTTKKAKLNADREGNYVTVVNMGKKKEDVLMQIKQKGKAFESKLIKNETSTSKNTFVKNQSLEIKEIKKGGTYTLNNINYATNSAKISEDSKLVLDGFADWLLQNDNLKIEIQGHTDDLGNDASNLALSQDRAYSVMEYLAEKGLKLKRMKFKGYGETQPKVANDSPENRAKNRRTDFKIL